MRRKILFGLGLLGVFFALLRLTGCSLVGLGVGSLVDAGKPSRREIPGWEVETVKPGSKLDVFLKSGEMLTGKFLGVETAPKEAYAEKYSLAREQAPNDNPLPSLGDTVTVVDSFGERGKGEFLGFDYLSIVLKSEQKPEPVRVSLSPEGTILDGRGNRFEGTALRELTVRGQIPLLSQILVERQRTGPKSSPIQSFRRDTTRIATNEISQVQLHLQKKGKKTGFLIGAAVDVAVLIAVAVISSSGDDGGGGGGGSTPQDSVPIICGCPFVYGFDGQKYALEGECFGGSIFKAAQRTDWVKLNGLRPAEGACRLKIANELPETDYIDEARLLGVAHPLGTEVVPSFSGKFHTFSAPRPPVAARDLRGTDILSLVKAKDELVWVSNPFGRNPQNKQEVRDGLVLEFPCPPGAASVKFAFNTKNTPWAATLQSHFLTLFGAELNVWYEQMNSSPAARRTFQEAFAREGMLSVELWNGSAYQNVGFVWEVGTAAFREQAVWVDLEELSLDTLRIRLASTAGLWMVDGVRADYSADSAVEVKEYPILKAVDDLGKDRSSELIRADEDYAVLPKDEWMELSFEVPAQKPGRSYSFLLQCAGYYTVNVPAAGRPQSNLVQTFLREPGAFGQYALKRLNGSILTTIAAEKKE